MGYTQNLLGIATSRFGGTNRLYINPALAADSPAKFYLNVATANGHVDNNYVRYQAPYSLLSLITNTVPSQYRASDGSVKFETDYTHEILNGKPKNGTMWGEVRGPSFLVKVGEGSALALSTRFRGAAQIVNASEPLLSSVRASLGNGSLYALPTSDNKFSANTSTYSEIGLTYATTLLNEEGRKLLFGTTAKFLIGYNAQQLINRGMDYRVYSDPSKATVAYLEVDRLNATLAYTSYLQGRSINPSTLFSGASPGRGFGLDLGFTYIDQYDEDSPTLQLGVAVTDIGGLTYKGQQYDYTDADLAAHPVQFLSTDFNSLNSGSSIIEVIQNKLNTGRQPDSNTFREGLPTSLNLTADYQLPGGLGINLTYLLDLRSVQAMAIHQPTLLAVTPRYDARWLSLAVPIAYLNGGLTAGASVRLGPAWLGTDNLLGLIGSSTNGIKPRGSDIYLGVAFGIRGREEE